MSKKIITILISFCLIFEQIGFAQIAGPLVLPAFVGGSTAGDAFRPEHLRSLSYQPMELSFKTLLDKGSAKEKDPAKIENSTRQLFKYFFVGLSLPNDSFWVNLRPDSPDNIIDEDLGRTDIGKVMLEADVQLKKDVAKYTSPDTIEGKIYWDKLYSKAEELFGRQDLSIPTLTRPWIVPDEIILRQSANNAYIYKATLKVMLEADHLKDSPEYKFDDPRMKDLNDYSSRLIRELVLPRLSRDVNVARRYAALRQVYFSLILAQWFKNKYAYPQKNHDLLRLKIDSRDLKGLTSKEPWSKEVYFKEYRRSFKEGEYNKQENIQNGRGISLRQYFSGGVKFDGIGRNVFPDGGIQARTAINFLPGNTEPETIKIIPGSPFEIQNIQAGASQSGGLPIVGSTNLPPGAPVSISPDGGKNEADLIQGFGPGKFSEPVLKGAELDSAIADVFKESLPSKDKYRNYERLAEAGVFIFGGYQGYLNEKGLRVKNFFDDISLKIQEGDSSWERDFDEFRRQIVLIPRISGDLKDLHLELFHEVFEGLNDEQLQAFLGVGRGSRPGTSEKQNMVALNLTQGCSNQCLICGIRGWQRTKLGSQVPFPVAVKVMQRISGQRTQLMPYRDSDPLDYYDEISGATMVDIVKAGKAMDFFNISILTHGTNFRKDQVPGILKELSSNTSLSLMGVSFHVYHAGVLAYAIETLNPEKDKQELARKKEAIVQRYTERFSAMIRALDRVRGARIRVFDAKGVIGYIEDFVLSGNSPRNLNDGEREAIRRALSVIKEMQTIQDAVWERTQKAVPIVFPVYSGVNPVVWIGGAAQLLKRLGIPEDIIVMIQEGLSQKINLSPNAFDPIIDTDGSLVIAASEDQQTTIRQVKEVFKDPTAREFKWFVELAGAMVQAKDHPAQQFRGPEMEDRDFKRMVFEDLKPFLESSGVDYSGMNIDDFQVRHRYFTELDSFLTLQFPRAKKTLLSLEDGKPIDEQTTRDLYDELSDLPFPVRTEFYVTFDYPDKFANLEFKTDERELTHYKFKYSFGAEQSVLRRDIYQPYRMFRIKPWKAFSGSARKDGGYERINSPADLRLYAQEILKTPGAKNLKVWFDIDNTIFDHKLKANDTIFYPTQDFVSERLKMIRASLSEAEYKNREKEVLDEIAKECTFWEKRWLEAKKFKKVEGIIDFLAFAKKNGIEVDLITNRFNDPELKKVTIDSLNSLKIEQGRLYSNIIFVGAGNGKAERIRGNIKNEQVFFVDNNERYVKSIADQLKDLPDAKIFYLDRNSHEGSFTYEELKGQAEALLAAGPENPEDRAATELFLGCAALEIAKFDKAIQPEKIAEIRSLMQRSGSGRPGVIDRTYIDRCLEDLEKGIEPARSDGGSAAPGGIDLRRLPINSGAVALFPAKVGQDLAVDPRLDAQWQDIRELVSKGFLPESGRIKECLRYCRAGGVSSAGIESILACLADMLRIEEDQNLPTETCLKELLALLESN